jgi:hypothetical protein
MTGARAAHAHEREGPRLRECEDERKTMAGVEMIESSREERERVEGERKLTPKAETRPPGGAGGVTEPNYH